MLVFNCTKAAADFFTTKKKGEILSPVEAPPHKTIHESIAESVAISNAYADTEPQWHWLVHAKKIKRKNILVVMEYQSRFSITLTNLKKGDELAFLNQFEHHLIVHSHEIMTLVTDAPQAIEDSIDNYHHQHQSCAFYLRGDRSVQSHINDVFWHFEQAVYETGEVLQDVDLIGFDAYVNDIIRNLKGGKDYFFPKREFLRYWLSHYGNCSEKEADKLIEILREKERRQVQSQFDDILEQGIPPELQNGSDADLEQKSKIVSLDTYRKKQTKQPSENFKES